MDGGTTPEIAVLIPCHNEELTVGKVVDDVRSELPDARIFVYDNASTDHTAEKAVEHGAVVIHEPRKGKGYVIERMLNSVDADVIVMIDGDDTLPTNKLHEMIAPILAGKADMVIGARLASTEKAVFRNLHVFGNNLVRWMVNKLGNSNLSDIMSGYRAINRRVLERLPVLSAGFEVETEMTIKMLYYEMKIVEVPVEMRDRPPGSFSKLSTFRDGSRVIWTIFMLFRSFRPLIFFGGIGMLLLAFGLVAGAYPVYEYFFTPSHYVTRVPSALLAVGLVLLSGGFLFLGVILDAINRNLRDLHNVLTRSRYSTGIHSTEQNRR